MEIKDIMSISVERGGRRGNYPGARAPRGPENSVCNGIEKPMQHYGCIKWTRQAKSKDLSLGRVIPWLFLGLKRMFEM